MKVRKSTVDESLLQDLEKDHKNIKSEYGIEVYNALSDYIKLGNDLGNVLYKESEWNKFLDWAKENGIIIKNNNQIDEDANSNNKFNPRRSWDQARWDRSYYHVFLRGELVLKTNTKNEIYDYLRSISNTDIKDINITIDNLGNAFDTYAEVREDLTDYIIDTFNKIKEKELNMKNYNQKELDKFYNRVRNYLKNHPYASDTDAEDIAKEVCGNLFDSDYNNIPGMYSYEIFRACQDYLDELITEDVPMEYVDGDSIKALADEDEYYNKQRARRIRNIELLHKIFDSHGYIDSEDYWADKVHSIFYNAEEITVVDDASKVPDKTDDGQKVKYVISTPDAEVDVHVDVYGDYVWVVTKQHLSEDLSGKYSDKFRAFIRSKTDSASIVGLVDDIIRYAKEDDLKDLYFEKGYDELDINLNEDVAIDTPVKERVREFVFDRILACIDNLSQVVAAEISEYDPSWCNADDGRAPIFSKLNQKTNSLVNTIVDVLFYENKSSNDKLDEMVELGSLTIPNTHNLNWMIEYIDAEKLYYLFVTNPENNEILVNGKPFENMNDLAVEVEAYSSENEITESIDEKDILSKLDQFKSQITINKEDEKALKDILLKKNISFTIDDSRKDKLKFRLKYESVSNSSDEDDSIYVYSDYNLANAKAEDLGLILAEYGDLGKFSYCYWNKSGDRNDPPEIYVYYKFIDGEPAPLDELDIDAISRDENVKFYESLTESLDNYSLNRIAKTVLGHINETYYEEFKLVDISQSKDGLITIIIRSENIDKIKAEAKIDNAKSWSEIDELALNLAVDLSGKIAQEYAKNI